MRQVTHNVIGLEISDSLLTFVQIQEARGSVRVVKMKQVPPPPKAIIDGKIIDPDGLQTTILTTLTEGGFSSNQFIIGLNHRLFMKHVDRFPGSNATEIKELVDHKFNELQPLLQEEYWSGHQLVYEEKMGQTEFVSVLYAGMPRNRLSSFIDLLESIGLNVVAIDLPPLAGIRALGWSSQIDHETIFSILISDNYCDYTILDQGNIKSIFTYRRPIEEFHHLESLMEFSQSIHNFIMAHENRYPNSNPIMHVWVIPHSDSSQILFSTIESIFHDLKIDIYDPHQNISFEFGRHDPLVDTPTGAYITTIGLALKYYERHNKTLSLIKVKKQIDPIVNTTELVLMIVTLMGVGLITVMITFYLDRQLQSTTDKTQAIKIQIKELATGEYTLKQKELMGIKGRILELQRYANDRRTASTLIQKIFQNLPSDTFIDGLTANDDGTARIIGNAYLPSSVYQVYEHISHNFSNAILEKIDLNNDNPQFPIHKFSITFVWTHPR